MKKIPMRKCVVTQTQHPKNELIRVVLSPENEICIDPSGKMNGRGAYLQKDLEVIEKAKKNKSLDRALKAKIPDEIFESLITYVR